MVYALDSSTIDLCLSLFPWAKFRKTKGAVKMHTRQFIHIYSNFESNLFEKTYIKELFSGNINPINQSYYPILPLWEN
jgi:hypothetical protein